MTPKRLFIILLGLAMLILASAVEPKKKTFYNSPQTQSRDDRTYHDHDLTNDYSTQSHQQVREQLLQ